LKVKIINFSGGLDIIQIFCSLQNTNLNTNLFLFLLQIFSSRLRQYPSGIPEKKSFGSVSVPRNRLSPVLVQDEDTDQQTVGTRFDATPRHRTRHARMRKDLSRFVTHRQRFQELSFVLINFLFV
jgi:hypothetical protein